MRGTVVCLNETLNTIFEVVIVLNKVVEKVDFVWKLSIRVIHFLGVNVNDAENVPYILSDMLTNILNKQGYILSNILSHIISNMLSNVNINKII
jgi:hypothetical protein